jgi:hypothetical protein
MGAAKFLVLVGGIVGIVSFFTPLMEITGAGAEAKISALQIVKGIDTVSDVATGATKSLAEAAENSGDAAVAAELKKGTNDLNSKLAEVKGIVLALWAPALLLLVIGGVAAGRKQFGRLGGSFSFLLGAAGLLVAFGFYKVLGEAAKEGTGQGLIGVHLYAASGALGLIGGLMALIKPERKDPVF